MGIEDVLDRLDDMVDKATQIPLSGGKCIVNSEKIRDCIDDIRLNLPTEIKQAKAIVMDRTDIIDNAKREADSIIRRAEEQARVMVSESEIVHQAQAKANEIMAQATAKAKEIKSATNDFADNVFRATEEMLVNSLSEVKKARQTVKSSK